MWVTTMIVCGAISSFLAGGVVAALFLDCLKEKEQSPVKNLPP